MDIRVTVLIVTVGIVLISILAFYRLPPTGNVLISEGGSSGNVVTQTTTTTWPDSCSRPCALQGGVGMLDIKGKCISVKRFYDEKHCCVQADCGNDICNKGVCILDKLSTKKLSWPVDSRQVGCFGWQYDNSKPDDWEFNHGTDIEVSEDTEVKAMHSGRILNCVGDKDKCGDTTVDDSFGGYIIIADDTDLFYTLYGYLKCDSFEFELGDYVNEGDVIARSGGKDDCKGSANKEELYIEIRYEKNEKESSINPCLALDDCDCLLSCTSYAQRSDFSNCPRSKGF